ncbi:MAG: nucleotidyltransferase domain-containing protein [candidate division Zixibacteria bacterium]|nr:nucleotidyltransferase domain-containing protein [candidate division Zixibacteria bacterium]
MVLDTTEVNRKLLKIASDYSHALAHSLGKSLISVVLYGSVARQEASHTSDIDLLIIAQGLPKGQFVRKQCLSKADKKIYPAIQSLWSEGIDTSFTRILKTPEEASHIVPLYLDMVEDAVLLVDRKDFFKGILSQVRDSLKRLGARRISSGRIRYWDLKPDLESGERFAI